MSTGKKKRRKPKPWWDLTSLTKDKTGRNIIWLFVYGLASNFITYWVLSNLIHLDRGLTEAQLVTLGLVFSAVSLVLEIPGGCLADKHGQKKILQWSIGFGILKVLVILLARNYLVFLVAAILNAIERALEHGSIDALLYENFKARKQTKDYVKAVGLYECLRLGSYSLAAILGSVLAAQFGFDLIIWLSFPGLLLAMGAIWEVQNLQFKRRDQRKQKVVSARRIIVNSCKTAFRSRGVMSVLLYQALITTVAIFIWDYNELYFVGAGLPIALFGVMTAVMSWAEGLPQIFSARLFRSFPKEKAFALVMILGSVGLLLAALIPGGGGLFFFIFSIVIISFAYPLCSDYMNHRIPSIYRATIISLAFFIQQAMYIGLGFAFAYLIENEGVQVAYSLIAVVGLGYGFYYLWQNRRKISRAKVKVKVKAKKTA